MAFSTDQLLLPEDKASQLEKGLATLGVDDPLQYLCDEAAADVARLTTGYLLDESSIRTFIRSLALYRIYTTANVPPSKAIEDNYKYANDELGAIASGKRPNIAKQAVASVTPIAGSSGSSAKINGRIPGQT